MRKWSDPSSVSDLGVSVAFLTVFAVWTWIHYYAERHFFFCSFPRSIISLHFPLHSLIFTQLYRYRWLLEMHHQTMRPFYTYKTKISHLYSSLHRHSVFGCYTHINYCSQLMCVFLCHITYCSQIPGKSLTGFRSIRRLPLTVVKGCCLGYFTYFLISLTVWVLYADMSVW